MAIFYEPEHPSQRYDANGAIRWLDTRDFIKCCVCQRYQKNTDKVAAFQQEQYLQFCCEKCHIPEWFQTKSSNSN